MRWICPRCGKSVNLALNQCPYCLTSEAEPSPPAAAPETQPSPPRPRRPPKAKITTGESSSAWARFLARTSALLEEPEESSLVRGFRMGVGFMLAVVTIALLIGLVWFWLSRQPG
ncbi:MAG: hypothetical protein ACE5G6_05590 [Terriglobia bacterium]